MNFARKTNSSSPTVATSKRLDNMVKHELNTEIQAPPKKKAKTCENNELNSILDEINFKTNCFNPTTATTTTINTNCSPPPPPAPSYLYIINNIKLCNLKNIAEISLAKISNNNNDNNNRQNDAICYLHDSW